MYPPICNDIESANTMENVYLPSKKAIIQLCFQVDLIVRI